MQAHLTDAQIVEQLGRSRLLRGVAPADLARLLGRMRRESFPAGAVVFEAGAPGDALYVILAGRARVVTRDPLGHDLALRTYAPGEVFGEFAVLDGRPRSATVQAEEPLDVLALRREDFLRFLDGHPLVGLAMMRSMVERVRYTTGYLQQVMEALDLLLIGDYEQALKSVPATATDAAIQRLIDAYLDMVRGVRAREASLRPPDEGGLE